MPKSPLFIKCTDKHRNNASGTVESHYNWEPFPEVWYSSDNRTFHFTVWNFQYIQQKTPQGQVVCVCVCVCVWERERWPVCELLVNFNHMLFLSLICQCTEVECNLRMPVFWILPPHMYIHAIPSIPFDRLQHEHPLWLPRSVDHHWCFIGLWFPW